MGKSSVNLLDFLVDWDSVPPGIQAITQNIQHQEKIKDDESPNGAYSIHVGFENQYHGWFILRAALTDEDVDYEVLWDEYSRTKEENKPIDLTLSMMEDVQKSLKLVMEANEVYMGRLKDKEPILEAQHVLFNLLDTWSRLEKNFRTHLASLGEVVPKGMMHEVLGSADPKSAKGHNHKMKAVLVFLVNLARILYTERDPTDVGEFAIATILCGLDHGASAKKPSDWIFENPSLTQPKVDKYARWNKQILEFIDFFDLSSNPSVDSE